MAFLKNRNAASPGPPVPIPLLDEDPEYERFATARRALMDAAADRQRRLDIFTLRSELNAPAVYPQGTRRATARARLAQLEGAAPAPKPAPAASGDLPPAIATALRIAAGDELDLPEDADAVKQRLRREMQIFDEGLRATEIALDEIRAERSAAVSEQQLATHQAILRSVWEAAAALAAAMDAERSLITEVILSGHDARPDILRRPTSIAAARIGSQSERDSDISTFKRALEDWKVL